MIDQANDDVAAGRQRSSDEEHHRWITHLVICPSWFVGSAQVSSMIERKKPEPVGSGLS